MMPRKLLSFLLIPLLLLPVTAMAQAGYTVEGVEVKSTASDGTTARMEAMTQGEIIAFEQLITRLLPAGEAEARIAAAKPHEISRMVRGYEIHDEKVSATSYAAKLDVNFDPTQVAAFLRGPQKPPPHVPGMPVPPQQAGQPAPPPVTAMPARQIRMPNMLVLPVWISDNQQALLWERDNIWRVAWNEAERSDTQFIRLPIGDQSDRIMIDGQQAIHASFSAFSAIAERYQSSTVIVAEARPTVSSGVNALAVRLRTLGREGQSGEQELTYEQRDGEPSDVLLARASQDIIQRVMYTAQQQAAAQQAQAQATAAAEAAAQQQAQQPAYMPRSKLTVLSRLQKLNDWVGLRKRLMALPMVEQVDMAAISSRQVDLVVHYRGSMAQLESAMVSQGIGVQKARNYWVVSF